MIRGLLLAVPLLALLPFTPAMGQDFDGTKEVFVRLFDDPESPAEDRLDAVIALRHFDTRDAAKLQLTGVVALENYMAPLVERKLKIDTELQERHKDKMFDQEQSWGERKLNGRIRRLKKETQELQEKIDLENRVLDAIVGNLSRTISPEVVEYLARVALLREKSWRARLVVAQALSEIREASTIPHLVKAIRDKDPRVRAAAIHALGMLKATEAVDDIVDELDAKTWTVRSAAMEALGEIGDKGAVEPLIDRMPKETGQLAADCARALTVLTGEKFGTSPEIWKRWWGEHRAEYGGADGKVLGDFDPDESSDAERRYYGLPVVTDHAIFILDVSGSMAKTPDGSERTPKEGELSKIEIAKKELTRVIDTFNTRGTLNLIVFNNGVKKWKKGMVPATRANKDAAMAWVKDLGAMHSTNIYDAMQEAFQVAGMGVTDKYYDPAADTIFLLSDGSPTKIDGTEDDWEKIVRAVDEWNRLKRVKIHTIGVGGHNVQFMRELAERNGGKYVAR